MKQILLALSLTLLCGCVSPAKLASALAKDPATAFISVQTIYGNVKVIRTNPQTNTAVKISGDGEVEVNRSPSIAISPTLDEHVRALERLRAIK